MRQELDLSILNNIKYKIINNPNLVGYRETIINNMNEIKGIYVENLKETSGARMRCRSKEIVLDKSFCKFDSSGKVIGLDYNQEQLITSQLGHELLHSASRNNNYSGINDSTDNYRGLNEGITQLLIEEIFGYVLSPFSDGYKDSKKIAKIIKNTIGINSILKSYFNHTTHLKSEISYLTNNTEFYEELNKDLTNLYYMKRFSKDEEYRKYITALYNLKVENIYKKVIVNIIIPHLRKLNDNDKKIYIKNILNDIKDDKEIEKLITNILLETINMSDKELIEYKNIIKLKDKEILERQELTQNLYIKDKKVLAKIYVNNNGEIFYLSKPPHRITNQVLKDKIYLLLYDDLTIKLDYKTLEQCLKSIKNNISIKFNTTSTLNKYIYFAKIKEYAYKNNLIILNSEKDLENSNIIKINYIENNTILSFKDIKTLVENYYIVKDNKQQIVKDRKYNNTYIDEPIKTYALFANLWLSSASTYTLKDEKIQGITSAFNTYNELIYNDIMKSMYKNININGKLNLKELLTDPIKMKNNHKINLINRLFKNQTTYEIVYKYIMINNIDRKLLSEKEKSIAEINNPNYDERRIEIKTEQILRGK